MPNALAIDTAITRPRALNEPVGKRASSFTRISPPRNFFAISDSGNSGVTVSPRLTMFRTRRTGSNSR
jgi:hypothetical protein